MTSSMSAGASPVRPRRPRRAVSPSSAALSAFRAPPYRPIGVRTGSQITTSRMTWFLSAGSCSHGPAAGDLEHRAGHVGGQAGSQEEDDARDLRDLARPAHGDLAQFLFPGLGRHRLGHRGADEPGLDGVDAYPVAVSYTHL